MLQSEAGGGGCFPPESGLVFIVFPLLTSSCLDALSLGKAEDTTTDGALVGENCSFS